MLQPANAMRSQVSFQRQLVSTHVPLHMALARCNSILVKLHSHLCRDVVYSQALRFGIIMEDLPQLDNFENAGDPMLQRQRQKLCEKLSAL